MKNLYVMSMVCAVVACCLFLTRESLFAADDLVVAAAPDLALVAAPDKTVAPVVSKEEEEEYKKLAAKNAQAKEFLNDIKVFAALANQLTELIPQKEVEIKGAKFNLSEVREVVRAMIGTFYNIGELGLGIIRIVEDQSPAINLGVKCLSYTDADLKHAAKTNKGSADIMKCVRSGCKTTKGCIARTVKMSALAFSEIVDNGLGKYDAEKGNLQRGLILNVDYIINWIIGKVLTVPSVKEYLASKKIKSGDQETNYLQHAEKWYKALDSVRTVTGFAAATMSGVAQALVITSGIIDPTAITDAEMKQYEETIREGQKENIDVSDKALDNVVLGDSLDDLFMDLPLD